MWEEPQKYFSKNTNSHDQYVLIEFTMINLSFDHVLEKCIYVYPLIQEWDPENAGSFKPIYETFLSDPLAPKLESLQQYHETGVSVNVTLYPAFQINGPIR